MNQCLKWFSVEIDRRTLTIWIVCRNSKEFTLINIVRSDIESSSLFKNIIFLIVIYTIVIVNVFICELYWIIIISVRFTIIVIFIASNKKFRLGWVKWSQNEVPLWWVVVTLTLSLSRSLSLYFTHTISNLSMPLHVHVPRPSAALAPLGSVLRLPISYT